MINTMMWIFITMQVLGAITTIAMIGKDRKPTTPGIAVISVVVSFALAAFGALAVLRVI